MNAAMEAIEEYYGDTKAERTGIPYINHIREGCQILRLFGANENVISAFALHPIFQSEENPEEHPAVLPRLRLLNAETVFFAREYKKTANAYLCKPHYTSADDHIELSKHESVNLMLVADKIQNRKDFEQSYEPQADKSVFARSENLAQYFRNWLRALGVSEEKYRATVSTLIAVAMLNDKPMIGSDGKVIPLAIREIARLAIEEYGNTGTLYFSAFTAFESGMKVHALKIRIGSTVTAVSPEFAGRIDRLLASETPQSLGLKAVGREGLIMYQTLIYLPAHAGMYALVS